MSLFVPSGRSTIAAHNQLSNINIYEHSNKRTYQSKLITENFISDTNRSTGDDLIFSDNSSTDSRWFDDSIGSNSIKRVSIASDGTEANAESFLPSISDDGRYIAFQSDADNLDNNDTNGTRDVFVHDSHLGSTALISVGLDGYSGNGYSSRPSISADGRYVAFASGASNLVSGDNNDQSDVFVYDQVEKEVSIVSIAMDGKPGNGHSGAPDISSGGLFVAYQSFATNLVSENVNGIRQVYLYDKAKKVTTLVSINDFGLPGNNESFIPYVSTLGLCVAYSSSATNLVNGDTNDVVDVFVRDLHYGLEGTYRVSVASNGSEASAGDFGGSAGLDISDNCTYAVFETDSNNLVPEDTNDSNDVFVHGIRNGVTTRVSVDSDGIQQTGGLWLDSSISGNGRFIAFKSGASNLVVHDNNLAADIFVHDLECKTTTRISVSSDGNEGDGNSGNPSISYDGRYVAFYSEAINLVGENEDTNGHADVFVHDREGKNGLSISCIEINQGIGNQYKYAEDYVARKDTAIRVYLLTPINVNSSEQNLIIKKNGNTIATLSPEEENSPTEVLTFLCPNREKCGNWEAGDYTFEASVNGVVLTKTATFQEQRKLRILAVPVKARYKSGKDKSVSEDMWENSWEFANKVYPLPSDSIELIPDEELDATNLDLYTKDGRSELSSLLKKKQPFLCKIGLQCYDAIVGFIPFLDFDNRIYGWESMGTVVVTANDFVGVLFAHEIGHIYDLGDEYNGCGRFRCDVNPPPSKFTGNQWGTGDDSCNYQCTSSDATASKGGVGTGSIVKNDFDHPYDVVDQAELRDKLSIMGNGERVEDVWITPRTHYHLFNKLSQESTTVISTITQSDEEFIQATGWISKDNVVTLEPWYHFISTSEGSNNGIYSIEAIDANGMVLASQNFVVDFVQLTNPPTIVDRAPFKVLTPFHIGTTEFQIKNGETVIKAIQVSLNAPEITLLSPNGGENWSSDESHTISWEASDADGEMVFYTVEYSSDNVEWKTLATDITSTQYTVDAEFLPGGSNAKIRVFATDGINTSSDESDGTFTVDSKAPRASILSPQNGEILKPDQSFYLHGYGYDLEDGIIDESRLSWISDLDGYLGVGGLILRTLSVGEHDIYLYVTDNDGNISTDSVTVIVEQEDQNVFLPILFK